MGHKEKLINGDEYDAIYGKHIYVYLGKPGISHAIKKRISRRIRRKGRISTKRLAENGYMGSREAE